MSTWSVRAPRPALPRPTSFLARLDGQPALGHVAPHWFTPVMGTGIVANAAAPLPVRPPALLVAAEVVWVVAAVALALAVAATVLHWLWHPAVARGHLDHPVTGHFYGAPAMALMTVGAGAVLVGQPLVGERAAVVLLAVLWTAGTALGLATTVVVPLRMLRRRALDPAAASACWLLPVVPPMVSAATGPLLASHLPPGAPRVALLLACVAMAALALTASLPVVVVLVRRLAHHGVGPVAAAPTLFIVLGPLGQSVTAAHTVSASAGAGEAAGLGYGLVVGALALAWMTFATVVTARAARAGLPFSLAWWSFTFPVGTVVTGTSGLAAATGETSLVALAVVLYAALVTAWLTVGTRTARGLWSGHLLRAPA